MKWYQQGDVLLKPLSSLKHGKVALERVRGHVKPDGIVALGEHTGHMHKLAADGEWTLYDDGEHMFIEVGPSGATLLHEEHLPQTLPEGCYVVERVKEVDHFAASEAERRRERYVAD